MSELNTDSEGLLTPRSALKQQIEIVERAMSILESEREKERLKNRPISLVTRDPRAQRLTKYQSDSTFAVIATNNVTSDVLEPGKATLRSEAQLRSEPADQSYEIRLHGTEFLTCPDCLTEVESRELRRHKQSHCTGRTVTCPNVACKMRLPLMALSWHLREECTAEKGRREMVTKARQRYAQQNAIAMGPPPISEVQQVLGSEKTDLLNKEEDEEYQTTTTSSQLCPQCGEGIPDKLLRQHAKSACRFRIVSCPNALNGGCTASNLTWASLPAHLANECEYEKNKLLLVERAMLRRTPVPCRLCGALIPLPDQHSHEERDCPNRLIPCQNCHLGCPAMLPLLDRALHEKGKGVEPRYVLSISGQGSGLHIDESDLTCPWTLEFWAYRSLPTASLAQACRTLFLHSLSYEIGYHQEKSLQNEVLSMVNKLKKDSKAKKSAPRTGESKEEAQHRLSKESQERMELVQSLSALVPLYSKAAIQFVQGFQTLAIAVEKGIFAVEDIINRQPATAASLETLVSLAVTHLGETTSSKPDTDDVEPAETAVLPEESSAVFTPDLMNFSKPSLIGRSLMEGNSSLAAMYRYCWRLLKGQTPTDSKTMRPDTIEILKGEFSPSSDIVVFIVSFLTQPRLALGQGFSSAPFSLSVASWRNFLLLVARLLKVDFDWMQDRRVEAGLITPQSGSSGVKVKLTPAQEKQKKKQEREKRRREQRLNAVKLAGSGDPETPDIAPVVHEPFSDLFGEAIRQGCGTDVIAESLVGKVNPRPTKVCLSLFSGLSLLLPPDTEAGKVSPLWPQSDLPKDEPASDVQATDNPVSTVEEFGSTVPSAKLTKESSEGLGGHHYDLLMSENDWSYLSELNGFFGLVGVPFMSRKGGNNKPIDSLPQLDLSEGTQVACFKARIPRGRWFHISLVSVDSPRRRTTLYLDGIFFQNYSSYVTALPMSTLCGSLWSPFSFSGAFIDLRIWSRALSAREIRNKYRSLITLSSSGGATTSSRLISTNTRLLGKQAAEQFGENPSATNGGHMVRTTKRAAAIVTTREDDGLIGWWTFEDGLSPIADVHTLESLSEEVRNALYGKSSSKVSVSDVTFQRFKIPFRSDVSYLYPVSLSSISTLPSRSDEEDDTPISEIISHPSLLSFLASTEYWKSLSAVSNMEYNSITGSSQADFALTIVRDLCSLRRGAASASWREGETIPLYGAPLASTSEKSKTDSGSTEVDLEYGLVDTGAGDEEARKAIHAERQRHRDAEEKARKSSLPYYLFLDNDVLQGSDHVDDRSSSLPLPSYRRSQVCPFELRRQRLARRGRDLHKNVECPLACGELVRSMNLRGHVRFHCPKRLVSCSFPCCIALFPMVDREQHERTNCVWSKQRNQMAISAESREAIVPCPDCSKEFKVKHFDAHRHHECPFRLVLCDTLHCSLSVGEPKIPFARLAWHHSFECDAPSSSTRRLLINRSRERHSYPRPWGIQGTISADGLSVIWDDENDAAISPTPISSSKQPTFLSSTSVI